jgi:hypothetical protein
VYCYRYLAQNYLAEALCFLGRYEEAYEIMDIHLIMPSPADITSEDGTDRSGGVGAGAGAGAADLLALTHIRPELIPEVLRNTNRAVIWALLGKLSDSQIILESILSECPSFPPAIRCLVYIFLRQGKIQEARDLLVELNVSPETITFLPSPM